MVYLENLIGKVIAEKVNESVELQLLKHKLCLYIESLTNDESAITRLEELFQAILVQAQTDSKYEGFLEGIKFSASTD